VRTQISLVPAIILGGVLAVAGISDAWALINPNFTPVHLVKQSSLILELQLAAARDGKITARVGHVWKGTYGLRTVTLVLSARKFPDHAKTVARLAESTPGVTAVLFAGEFAADPGAGGAEPGPAAEGDGKQKALVHVAGTWVAFSRNAAGEWEMDTISETMATTWNGGSDMLLRAVEYILTDPDAELPVKEGVHWSGFRKFAKLDGIVHAAVPVDLAGDGQLALFIACEGGDRLFRYDAKTQQMADITRTVTLASSSRAAAWGDFNAHGRMDLLSWDGEGLTIHTQRADGSFRAGDRMLSGRLTSGCLGLACIDSGKAGHPAVVISTRTSPLLWTPNDPQHVTRIGGAFAGGHLGAPHECLIADLDGDAVPDILQPLEKGSLIYRGKTPGRFDDAMPCGISAGPGTAAAFLGDYDADGRLDVVGVASRGTTHLWSNRGRFAFVDTLAFAGELSYKGADGAIGGMTVDFNNDGRQDLFFCYAASSPRLYFNRGFRTFGLANGMDLETGNFLPQAAEGQQAACFADFTGTGAPAMILVLRNGEAWVFSIEAGEGSARCVRAALPSRGPYVGPLTVTGWRGNRCLGAWNVTAGTSEAFFGQTEAGPMTLKWRVPGKAPREKEIVVENKPVRFVITP
jgi:hypothetical protein